MYTLYIGSNNKTGELDVIKAIDIIGKYFSGFTYWKAKGIWKGTSEDTLIIQIAGNSDIENPVYSLVRELKYELSQDTILLSYASFKNKFI